MWIQHNENPVANRVGDCTVRAISKVTEKGWERTYLRIAVHGLLEHDMPSANHVWGVYLEDLGFKRHALTSACPNCYTVKDFAAEHPRGRYVLSLAGHVVACIDGDYFDTWDSGDEIVLYYWEKEE